MSGGIVNGWVETNLGTVSTHPQYGWTCSSTKNGSLKLLRTTDISSGKVDWDDVPYCSAVPDQIEKFVLGKNDIVVSRAGSIGVSYCLSDSDLEYKAVFASYLIRFRPLIPAAFVYYYLKSSAYWQFISASQLGIAVPNVNASKLAELPLPLPPLNEQKRIVAKLDAIMPRIDSVKERLEKIPAILKRFRQSVLTAAVTGKLTEKWREEHPEVESVEALLEKARGFKKALHQNTCIAEKIAVTQKKKTCFFREEEAEIEGIELPRSWNTTYLGNISWVQGGVQKTPKRKPVNNFYRYLSVANVYRGFLKLDNVSSFEATESEFDQYKLIKGDLLIVEGNGSAGEIGRCAIWSGEIEKCIHQNHIIRARPVSSLLDSSYSMLFFNSNFGIKIMMGIASTTSGLYTLSVSKVNNLPIPLPPLEEQKEIVRQVDKLFALADKVEEHYQKAWARVDALSQSVLAKAFRGELVPQDPDDEPAEKLLQRIQEEKEKMENELKNASRSARGTRRNGAKMQHTRPEEKQAGEP